MVDRPITNLRPIDERDDRAYKLAAEVMEWAKAGDLLSAKEALDDYRREAQRLERERVIAELTSIAPGSAQSLSALIAKLRSDQWRRNG